MRDRVSCSSARSLKAMLACDYESQKTAEESPSVPKADVNIHRLKLKMTHKPREGTKSAVVLKLEFLMIQITWIIR